MGCLGVRRLDNLQRFMLAVCLADAVFFSYYLFEFSIQTQSTISDMLFTRPEYTVVMTVLLAVRLLGGVLFLYRFQRKCQELEVAGMLGIGLALTGWCVLAWYQDNARHFAGVGVFCAGSFVYSVAFIRLAATNPYDGQETVRTVLEAFLLCSGCVLVIAFMALWMEEEDSGMHGGHDTRTQHAYIVEHMAYLVHLLFTTVFFLYHSPDPSKGMHDDNCEEYQDEVPMVCHPLIFQERLPVIMETGV